MTGAVLAQWKSSEDFGFTNAKETTWDLFRRALMASDIELTDIPDTLIWTRRDQSGFITTKNAYEAIASKYWLYNNN